MRIEWDANKEKANSRKHRVSFSLASEISLDPLVGTVLDPRHPVEENRFFSIGLTRAGRLCYRWDIRMTGGQ